MEKALLHLEVPAELRKKLKVTAAERDTTMQALAVKLLSNALGVQERVGETLTPVERVEGWLLTQTRSVSRRDVMQRFRLNAVSMDEMEKVLTSRGHVLVVPGMNGGKKLVAQKLLSAKGKAPA